MNKKQLILKETNYFSNYMYILKENILSASRSICSTVRFPNFSFMDDVILFYKVFFLKHKISVTTGFSLLGRLYIDPIMV